MRVDAFRPAAEFKMHMDQWITRFRNAKTVPEQPHVIIPGDPERESEVDRRKNGIPLDPSVVEDLRKLSEKLQVTFFSK